MPKQRQTDKERQRDRGRESRKKRDRWTVILPKGKKVTETC